MKYFWFLSHHHLFFCPAEAYGHTSKWDLGSVPKKGEIAFLTSATNVWAWHLCKRGQKRFFCYFGPKSLTILFMVHDACVAVKTVESHLGEKKLWRKLLQVYSGRFIMFCWCQSVAAPPSSKKLRSFIPLSLLFVGKFGAPWKRFCFELQSPCVLLGAATQMPSCSKNV